MTAKIVLGFCGKYGCIYITGLCVCVCWSSEPHLALSGFKKVLRARWRGSGSSIFGFEERDGEKNCSLQVVFEEIFVCF